VAVGNKCKILNAAEEKLIVSKIAEIEKETSGEVHIHISSEKIKNSPMESALYHFKHLGLDLTKNRNGVILYIAVKEKKFAIYGDEGIHKFIKQDGWNTISEDLHNAFQKGDFCIGIINAIQKIGDVLKTNFPQELGTDNPNELTDEISRSE